MLPLVNQILHISLDEGEHFSYKTRVADISQEFLHIEIPIDKGTGKFKLIPTDSTIVAWYISNDQGNFSFETKVVGIKKEEQLPLLLLKIPTQIQKIQKREYLRVAASIESSFKITGRDEKKWNLTRTIDVSGGGLQFVLTPPTKLSLDQVIVGWIVLPFKNGTIEHIKYQGKVVRIAKPKGETESSWISTKFTNIHEVDRAKIIRYCYEKQVELRKK